MNRLPPRSISDPRVIDIWPNRKSQRDITFKCVLLLLLLLLLFFSIHYIIKSTRNFKTVRV